MPTKRNQTPRAFPQLQNTPRWKPSTPHAIRALQQKSGARRRSNPNRPDSARNILRQLAKITAPQTKRRVSTPQQAKKTPGDRVSGLPGKENRYSPYYGSLEDDLEAGDGEGLERPDFTLPLEEYEDDDGDLEIPERRFGGEEEEHTWKYREFATNNIQLPASARSNHTRRSWLSIRPSLAGDNDQAAEEGDETVQSVEYGRRAISEGPAWERYPRSSFGSMRMSEFGMEDSRFGKPLPADQTLPLDQQPHQDDMDLENEIGFDDDGETENHEIFRRAFSEPVDMVPSMHEESILNDEVSFRLEMAQTRQSSSASVSDVEQPANEESNTMTSVGQKEVYGT